MAKPKGVDIVGWATHPSYKSDITIVAEKDVDQKRNRLNSGETYSSGHTVRQLGLARRTNPRGPIYHLYSHSQVSNGASYLYAPPAYVGMSREDLEWLFAVIGKELFGEEA